MAQSGASFRNNRNSNSTKRNNMDAKVYESIAKITEEMAHAGISKDRKNKDQNYSFRGIDDVYNSLSPLLAKYRLCILPCVLERNVVERQSSRGTTLFFVTVKSRFDFVCALDGSKHEVVTYGEAMDTSDKATNKAMSAAYKYAMFQAFCIPTQGDNDADLSTHEVIPASQDDEAEITEALLNRAADAAKIGVSSYKTFWATLKPYEKHLIGEQRHADFKILAEQAAVTA